MAFGPIFPHSRIPAVGNVYPVTYVGGGGNSNEEEGMGVDASLAADAKWRLRFAMPPALPGTGTLKLRLLALANAASGVAKVNPKWVSVAAGASPSSATPVAEGVSTVTWAAAENHKYKELKITLDAASAPAANEILVMDLWFETASWTLAQTSCWIASLIWE